MTFTRRSAHAPLAALALLMLSGSVSLLDSSMIVARPFVPVPAARRAAPARMSAEQCSQLAVKAAIAKARAEMLSIDAGAVKDLRAFGKAMDSDRRLAARVKETFANADLIEARSTRGGGCVVTVKLPLERLQSLTAGL